MNIQTQQIDSISCFGANDGIASAIVQGGTSPYSFDWITDSIFNGGYTVDTLSPGFHTVVVTDARGCKKTDTTLFIYEPDSLSVTINVLADLYCPGINTGVLQAIHVGGTGSYSYLWDDALQASQTTQIATNLGSDTFTVIVEDDRGCIASASAFISDTNPTMFLVPFSTDVSCYNGMDGSASVLAQGGQAPYTYEWQGLSNNFISSSDSIQSLVKGEYTVVVTDVNGCIEETQVELLEPDSIVFNVFGSSDELCLGACDGKIFLNLLSGGWSSSNYLALLTDNSTGVTYTLPVLNDTIFNVCSGDYTVSITNDDGCFSSVINLFLIHISEPTRPY